jgi:hypothetical protein
MGSFYIRVNVKALVIEDGDLPKRRGQTGSSLSMTRWKICLPNTTPIQASGFRLQASGIERYFEKRHGSDSELS